MIHYEASNRILDAYRARPLLEHLSHFYPGFDDWFVNKALPDIVLGHGVLLLAEEHNQVVGVGIGRKARDGRSAKLRCVRVADSHKSRGLGIHLIDRILPLVGNDRPALSVAEEMMHDYARILVNRFDFKLDHVAKGLYRKARLEYFFNSPREHSEQTPYGA